MTQLIACAFTRNLVTRPPTLNGGEGDGCGSFCSLKLPYLSTMSQQFCCRFKIFQKFRLGYKWNTFSGVSLREWNFGKVVHFSCWKTFTFRSLHKDSPDPGMATSGAPYWIVRRKGNEELLSNGQYFSHDESFHRWIRSHFQMIGDWKMPCKTVITSAANLY